MLPTFDELTLDALDTTTLDVLDYTAVGGTEKTYLTVTASPFVFVKKSGGGSTDGVLQSLLARTITEFSDNTLTSVGPCAFYSCSALTFVDLPVATSIGDYAFGYCISLTSVNLPVVTSIGNDAFYWCTALTTVNLGSTGNAVTFIDSNAFSTCTQSNLVINIYTADGAALSNSPFGATKATINYYQA